jgi:hypothetical protein
MKTIFFLSALIFSTVAFGQTVADEDSTTQTVKIIKDARLDILAAKQAEFNKVTTSGRTAAKCYRLMVINSADKDLVMKVRAQLLQRFPEQKVYMSFQAPYIKLKFGNFVEKADAEKYKKMLTNAKLVSTSIYMVPEMVEVKPDKNKDDN